MALAGRDNHMDTNTKSRTHLALMGVLAAVLAIGIIASCTLGALAYGRLSSQEKQIAELNAAITAAIGSDSDTVTQEDDVAVAGQYYIRSTLPISDAYKSGDTSQLDERQLETLSMASEVLDEIITDGMTPYEEEKAVYDWMCANIGHEGGVTVVVPTAPEYSAEPYGVLKYRVAVCVGYATTFRMFMQMLGIDCMVVHNSYHSWDLVKLDGDWYHTDIYSDAGSGDYSNFNMTDEMCAYGHNWDTNFYPAATGLKYCYAYMNAKELTNVYDIPSLVRDVLDADEVSNLYFLFDADEHTQQVVGELLTSTDSALMTYADMHGRDMWMEYNTQLVDGRVLLTINITDYSDGNNEPAADLTDEDYEQINEAVQDAFGDVYGDGTIVDDGTIDAGDGIAVPTDMPAVEVA